MFSALAWDRKSTTFSGRSKPNDPEQQPTTQWRTSAPVALGDRGIFYSVFSSSPLMGEVVEQSETGEGGKRNRRSNSPLPPPPDQVRGQHPENVETLQWSVS